MPNALIIHGTYGNPHENWFPWLKNSLEELGLNVYTPSFPTPENQSLKSWRKVYEEYAKFVDSDTLLIGHSLGPAFIFDILENSPVSIKATFLAVPFIGLLGNHTFDDVNYSISDRNFNWEKINNNSKSFYCYYSDNDPYVTRENSEAVSKKLNAKNRVIHNGGHLNESAGFIKFDLMLDDIKQIVIR